MRFWLAFGVFMALAFALVEAQNSCSEMGCNAAYDNSLPCQCNNLCFGYGNCCSDYISAGCRSCEAMGGCLDYDNRYHCQCNSECDYYGNCCEDYWSYCVPGAGDSCDGRCGDSPDTSKSCQCNTACETYNDCCSDYNSICGSTDESCSGRCGNTYDSSKPCQCNADCGSYGDCCSDYSSLCGGSGSPGGGSFDMSSFASKMWELDVNRISDSYYDFDLTCSASSASCNIPLFEYFNEGYIYNHGTFATYTKLCENYEPVQGINEDNSASDQAELNAYLDDIMSTALIQEAVTQLTEAGHVTSSADFRSKMETAFFEFYSRTSSSDSSGFEHCFCGEFKSSTKVNGFHNWITFYEQEKQGRLNYFGNHGLSEPNHLGVQFEWDGRMKSLTSIMLGVSTEFELAIYMACFFEKPDGVSSFTISDGSSSWPVQVQIYTHNGGSQIGTAYFIS